MHCAHAVIINVYLNNFFTFRTNATDNEYVTVTEETNTNVSWRITEQLTYIAMCFIQDQPSSDSDAISLEVRFTWQ